MRFQNPNRRKRRVKRVKKPTGKEDSMNLLLGLGKEQLMVLQFTLKKNWVLVNLMLEDSSLPSLFTPRLGFLHLKNLTG
ncbi:hypothetical protein Golax_022870 [Gossypium laxum]|uniref:Uncharacterized protein n=1 Tax=Gossypium laxum TaxID=34288 RepID=A0A7J9AZ18_9ROSI|nr:hypothetical protein [Gossypium laxum]